MIRLVMVLFLFFSLPFFLLALALKSIGLVAFGMLSGGLAILQFWFNSFLVFQRSLKPETMVGGLRERMEGFWKLSGPERVRAVFYRYAGTTPEFKVWVFSSGKVGIFFSQGALERVTDQEVQQAFRGLQEIKLGQIRNENRKFSFELILKRWKGHPERFRYWFFSFFLYPLERLLKIAKI